MVFNSFVFLLAFLPVAVSGAGLLRRRGRPGAAVLFLLAASVVFYATSGASSVAVLAGSIALNYLAALRIAEAQRGRRALFISGVAANLALLGAFKYAAPYAPVLGRFGPAVPLGISFFTLAQIAYLFEVYSAGAAERDPAAYALGVSFFPYVASGPITNYREIGPQLHDERFGRIGSRGLSDGLSLFFVGLFKKTVLSSGLVAFSAPIFTSAAAGTDILWWEAWAGAIAYGFQVYFDFSGYSDMAVGIARIFNVELPWNFDAPYKARNIVEFWRRWHISLSDWLRDFIFVPMNFGMLRRVTSPRVAGISTEFAVYVIATTVTMFACGLWHAATLGFLVWGLLHAAYLIVNRLFQEARKRVQGTGAKGARPPASRAGQVISIAMTFLAVTFAWVPFRAPDIRTTKSLWWTMAGGHGFALPDAFGRWLHMSPGLAATQGVFPGQFRYVGFWLVLSAIIVWTLPSSRKLFAPTPAGGSFLGPLVRPTSTSSWLPAVILSVIAVMAILFMDTSTGFIYFQF